MNLKKAKILRARIYGHGSRALRRELLARRQYVVRKEKRVERPTGELNPDGTPVTVMFRFITVGVAPGSLRAKYLAAKRAA